MMMMKKMAHTIFNRMIKIWMTKNANDDDEEEDGEYNIESDEEDMDDKECQVWHKF